MGRRITDSPRAREMRALLEEFDRSSLTAKAFAKQRGIVVSRLWYWRKRFREDARREAAARVVPVTVLPEPARDVVVEVKGRRVHVPRDFDAEALRRVVGVLESC